MNMPASRLCSRREFSHALLGAVAGNPEVRLAGALDSLLAAGLLFREGVPPNATYLFKHALVRDAAYSTLLRSRRQQLHARITGAPGEAGVILPVKDRYG